MFIVEALTTTGRIVETFATYEKARQRVEAIPAANLAGISFIFEELPDGSERLVRDDGKPLQWHRLAADALSAADEPLPLSDDALGLLDISYPF